MLNKHRYLVFSFDASERLFRVHFLGSLRACAYTVDCQVKLTGSPKSANIFRVMSVSDFAQFHTFVVGAKVAYPLNMCKKDLDALKIASEDPLYTVGFSVVDRFEYGK